MVSCSPSSTLSTYPVMSVTSMAYSSLHSCVGAPGDGGVVVYPRSPGPVTSGRSRPRDARYSAGPLLASWVGWWRRRALDRCVQGAGSRGGGRGGAFCRPGWPGSAGSLVAGLGSGGVRSICCSVSSVCSSCSSSRLSMSRAMGSSWACWAAASWCGRCVMLVLGVCAAAGAGPCAGARGSACFGVVVVCVCSLVAVPAGGVASRCGSGCGRWWASSWRVVCGVSRGGAGGGGGGVRSRSGVALFLCWWAVMFHALGWRRGVRCGMVVLGCMVAFPVGGGGAPCPGLVGWVVAPGWSPGGVGQPCAVSWSSLWCVSVRGPCGFVVVWGLGSPGAGCVGLECRNQ